MGCHDGRCQTGVMENPPDEHGRSNGGWCFWEMIKWRSPAILVEK